MPLINTDIEIIKNKLKANYQLTDYIDIDNSLTYAITEADKAIWEQHADLYSEYFMGSIITTPFDLNIAREHLSMHYLFNYFPSMSMQYQSSSNKIKKVTNNIGASVEYQNNANQVVLPDFFGLFIDIFSKYVEINIDDIAMPAGIIINYPAW